MKYLILLMCIGHICARSRYYPTRPKLIPKRFDKVWINYEPNDLRDWNTEVSVNGLFFSVNIIDPMAFYSKDEDLCQLIIPMNSDGNDTNFSWSPDDSRVTCPEQENENSWWLDPNNWDSNHTNKATPHLERIPCANDTIWFKASPDLYVILPSNPVKIRELYWNDDKIYSFMLNATSKYNEEFIKNFIVTGKNNYWDIIQFQGICKNVTGCDCGTMPHYKETCKLVEDECEASLPCDEPQKPEGHCCEICGCILRVTVSLETNDPFNFEITRLGIFNFFNTSGVAGVTHHTSKLSGDQLQIVIINTESSDNYDNIQNLASKLQTVLQNPSSGLLSNGIIQVDMHCSYAKSSYGILSTLSKVTIPLFALLAFGIFIVLLFPSKISLSKFTSSIGFSKFENQSEKSEEQSHSQKQRDQDESKNIEPELHSEGKSENGTSSELDDDSVLVELS